MGNLYDTLFKNFDIKKLTNLYNGSIRYNKGDAYDLDKDYLVFKDIKGQYLPKYTINGLDIYSIPGESLYEYLDKPTQDQQYSVGLWGTKDFNKDTDYLMVKNPDNETFSLIPNGRNISNLYDYYMYSPTSPRKGLDLFNVIMNNNNVNNRLNLLNTTVVPGYIGGSPQDVRRKFWERDIIMRNAVDSIANEYGIDPDALRYRIDNEGFTDRVVKDMNNNKYSQEQLHGYRLLHTPLYEGEHLFGLDDGTTYIRSGFAKTKGENWHNKESFIDGRTVQQSVGHTIADDIGLTAAVLKAFMDKAKEDFPNISEYDKNRYGQAYYHRGAAGGKNWVKRGAKSEKNSPDAYRYKKRNK